MTDPDNLAMLVEVVPSPYGDAYFHVTARVVKRVYRDGQWRAENFDFEHKGYNNLCVRAQGGLDDEQPPYGWEVEYRFDYATDLRLHEVERMVKLLRKVEKGLERSNAKLGYPDTLGAYIARVASILGVDAFGFFAPKGEKMWASGEIIRWDNASHLTWTINDRIQYLREQRAKTH